LRTPVVGRVGAQLADYLFVQQPPPTDLAPLADGRHHDVDPQPEWAEQSA
jgi:hypothetical protein